MASTLDNLAAAASLVADLASGQLGGQVALRYAKGLTFGTAAGNVNAIVARDLVIATGTPFTVDLTAAVDPAGNTVAFGHLTHWMLQNLSAQAGEDLTFFGGTNGVMAALPMPCRANGGNLHHADPNPGIAIDGAHKIVQITAAAGAAVAARLLLLGRTT